MVTCVLLIEDDGGTRQLIKMAFDRHWPGGVELLNAWTIQEAEELFAANQDRLGLVLVDGCVPDYRGKGGPPPNTPPLIRAIREAFAGPIIGMSADQLYDKALLEAGCDDFWSKDGYSELIETARRLVVAHSEA